MWSNGVVQWYVLGCIQRTGYVGGSTYRRLMYVTREMPCNDNHPLPGGFSYAAIILGRDAGCTGDHRPPSTVTRAPSNKFVHTSADREGLATTGPKRRPRDDRPTTPPPQ